MTTSQLKDLLQCSAGTFATVTGLQTYDEIGAFSNWISINHRGLTYLTNWGDTLASLFEVYQNEKPEESVIEKPTQEIEKANVEQNSRGMSLEEAKAHLENRGLEALLPGGFETIKRMQQGVA